MGVCVTSVDLGRRYWCVIVDLGQRLCVTSVDLDSRLSVVMVKLGRLPHVKSANFDRRVSVALREFCSTFQYGSVRILIDVRFGPTFLCGRAAAAPAAAARI